MRKFTSNKVSLSGFVFLLLGVLSILAWGLYPPSPSLANDLSTTYLPLIFGGQPVSGLGSYVVLGWNDLGMHCYDLDYSTLSVLPPYNTLWAQVIQRGDLPQVITTGVTVHYDFPDNTYSVGKTNFWEYADELFGVVLAPDIGLAGKGLAGEMEVKSDHFVAEGIPLTEFSDSQPDVPDYLQLANVVVKDAGGNTAAVW